MIRHPATTAPTGPRCRWECPFGIGVLRWCCLLLLLAGAPQALSESIAPEPALPSPPASLPVLGSLFRAGDDPAWGQPTISESGWKTVRLDRGWHSQELGMPWKVGDRGWYRIWIDAPSDAAGETWAVSAGFVGNISELWVNGHAVGTNGSFTAHEVTGQRLVHAALVPPGRMQPGSNLFAVRVLNIGGEGGILGGPVGVFPARRFIPLWTHTELQREVIRIGLAALCFGWAAIPLLFRLVGDRTRILRGSAVPAMLLGLLTLIHTQWWNSIDLGPMRPLLPLVGWLAAGINAAAIYGFAHNLGSPSRLWDTWATLGLVAFFPVSLQYVSDMEAFMEVYAGYSAFMQVGIAAQCLRAPPERRAVARATLVGTLALTASSLSVAALGIWPFLPFAALRWSPTDVSILAFLALLAGSLLRGHVRARNAQVELGRRLVAAHSEERRQIGRQLHDGVLQDIQYWRLQSDRSMEDLDGHAATERLDRVSSGLLNTARDLRRVAEDLQPLTTREVGLGEALEALGRRLSERHGVAVSTTTQLRDDVPDWVRETLYRIAQESGGNACRHSGAPEVSIAVTDDGKSVRLEVLDAGCGFDPGKVPEGHLGVRFLRDHAEWIGGRLGVESSPGTGTRVRIQIDRPFLHR